MSPTEHRLPRLLLCITLAVAALLSAFVFLAVLPIATGDIPYSFDGAQGAEGPRISDPGILPPGLLVLLLLIDCTAALALFLYLRVNEAV